MFGPVSNERSIVVEEEVARVPQLGGREWSSGGVEANEFRVRRRREGASGAPCALVDGAGHPVPIISGFLRYLTARGCSPNTVSAYAHDLLHFFRFLDVAELTWQSFGPPQTIEFLEYLRAVPARRPGQRLGLAPVARSGSGGATQLSPPTVNRVLAAVSSLYDYLILSGNLTAGDNPLLKRPDPAAARVSERHRPFMGRASRQRPMRRSIRVREVERLPRPLSDEQVAALLGELHSDRDRALVLVMLEGGLRPGEALGLQLADISYGRRRVVVRCRDDHPKGVRSKSRTERVVDLGEGAALAALSAYVMGSRPRHLEVPWVFLVGGRGPRRAEPLGYPALAKAFARAATRAGIREPWVTPHALRHTHATRMWEGGMRELTLQRRLGHASAESTRLYTRVADRMVVAEYNQALGNPAPGASKR